MNSEPLLLSAVGVSAGTPEGQGIFREVNVAVEKGHAVGILGPSGCGKTTLLAWLADSRLNSDRTSALSVTRPDTTASEGGRPASSYAPQGAHNLFIPHVSTDATIRALAERLPQARRATFLRTYDGLLTKFGLEPKRVRRRLAVTLSGGEAQRMALCATLALDPLLWLADEPTASLDEANKQRLAALLREVLARQASGMLIASHDEAFLRTVCDQIFELTASGLREAGPVRRIEPKQRPLPTSSHIAMTVRSVSQGYRDATSTWRWVIGDLSIQFENGRIYGVVGPSGSGKSTLLRILAGFERPARGGVRSSDETDKGRPNALLIPQDARAFFNPAQRLLPFSKNLATGLSPSPSVQELSAQLEHFGLGKHYFDLRPSEPSGGEMQRIALGVCIWLKPRRLYLDEIDSALDTGNKSIVAESIARFARDQDAIVVLATHDRAFAEALCDEIIWTERHSGFSGSTGAFK